MTHAFSDQDIPVCTPPDPHPHKPKFEFPPLACDCHAHICGPQRIYKYIPQRIYSPPDALLPEYRNQGIGTLLLRQLQEEANRGRKPLRLQIIRFNRAVNLLERLGFVRTSETGTHFQMEWMA